MKLGNEITTCDVVAIVSSALLIPFFELARTGSYWVHVNDWLDNRSYVQIANVIRVGGIPEGGFLGLSGCDCRDPSGVGHFRICGPRGDLCN